MKKRYFVCLAVVLAALTVSCGSAPASPAAAGNPVPPGVPAWYLRPPKSEDAIYGRGLADFKDLNLAITTAEARARTAISFTLSANVEAMVKDFTQSSGNAETQSTISFVQNVQKQLTSSKLTGVEIENTEVGPDGKVYVLAVMSKADAKKNLEDAFAVPEVARYAEFKADEAFRMLDAQIEKGTVDPSEKTTD